MTSPRPSTSSHVTAPRDAWLLAALEREHLVTPGVLETVRRESTEWVASALLDAGAVAADVLASVAARAAHVPVADLDTVDPAAAQFVPEARARQYAALPLSATNRVIRIATANPLDLDAEQALGFIAGRQVEFTYALPTVLFERIGEIYRPERSLERLVQGLGGQATIAPAPPAGPAPSPTAGAEGPAVKLVEATIADAVRERAGEIQLEPSEQGLAVRYVVDGVVREVMRVPRDASGQVVRRLKVLASLDIADPLHPHDGRATARVEGKAWDLRVSTTPMGRFGEKVTVALRDPDQAVLSQEALGLWPDEQARLERLLAARSGVVLAAGPAGNGRRALLYAALVRLRDAGAAIATVEDPLERPLPGANQIEVNEKRGLGFAAGLRSALRQRPGAVLVGDLRDAQTAAAVWQAAREGTLVLSALRAQGAVQVLARLRELCVAPADIAALLRGIVAQRLVRRLCPSCAQSADASALPDGSRPPAGAERVAIRAAKGCASCGFTGYRGRGAIQEVLAVEGAVADALRAEAGDEALASAAQRAGLVTLWQAGLRRVWSGETTHEELVRVVGAPGAAPPPLPAEGPLVLVADDDPAMRALITTILHDQNFRTAEAADGLEALDQAQRLRPAVMLLDMEMPRLDGFGVLEALRRRLAGRAVPVIVVTVRDDPATEARCLELGAEDYITKPFQPSPLVVRTRAVLRRVGENASWPRS